MSPDTRVLSTRSAPSGVVAFTSLEVYATTAPKGLVGNLATDSYEGASVPVATRPRTATSRSGSEYGRGRKIRAFSSEKNVVVAPIPSASVRMTRVENARYRA